MQKPSSFLRRGKWWFCHLKQVGYFIFFLTHAEMSTWLTTRVLTSLRSNQTFECWWLGFANNFAWICISPPACCGTSCWWQHQRCLWDISSCREFQNFHPVMQSHPSHPVHSTYSTEVLHPSEMAFLNGSVYFTEKVVLKRTSSKFKILKGLCGCIALNPFKPKTGLKLTKMKNKLFF